MVNECNFVLYLNVFSICTAYVNTRAVAQTTLNT